jgi:retinol dehydrogenase-12
MNPPQGSKTAQGYELQLGTNCVGTFMFTKLLTPLLISTAKISSPSSVRVVWVSSSAAEGLSPKGGVDMQNLDYKVEKLGMTKYGTSKAGNYLHATEFAKRYREEGIVSIPLNPGNLDSELYRSQGGVVRWVLRTLVLYPPIYGAYTLLFAGLSEEVTLEKSGDWGKFLDIL